MYIIYSLEIVWCYPPLYLPFHLSVTVKIIALKLLQKCFTRSEIKAKSPKGN